MNFMFNNIFLLKLNVIISSLFICTYFFRELLHFLSMYFYLSILYKDVTLQTLTCIQMGIFLNDISSSSVGHAQVVFHKFYRMDFTKIKIFHLESQVQSQVVSPHHLCSRQEVQRSMIGDEFCCYLQLLKLFCWPWATLLCMICKRWIWILLAWT